MADTELREHGPQARIQIFRFDSRLARSLAAERRLREERWRGRLTIERLRYRAYQRNGTLSDVMQRLGDFGRKYLPAIRAIRLRY